MPTTLDEFLSGAGYGIVGGTTSGVVIHVKYRHGCLWRQKLCVRGC